MVWTERVAKLGFMSQVNPFNGLAFHSIGLTDKEQKTKGRRDRKRKRNLLIFVTSPLHVTVSISVVN